jgi:uncharacterized NAD(P)/FAD-binding protein YdhS
MGLAVFIGASKSRRVISTRILVDRIMSNRIAIVGAGFCGTVAAANLLRRPPARPTEIVLIERTAVMGRGLAYAVHPCPYLLNVPAGRLSADSRDPEQFLRFARRTRAEVDAEDFLPRQLYGDYLEDFLLQAEREAPPHITLRRVFGEVLSLARAPDGGPLTLGFAEREPLQAHRVILALGNPAPAPLPWAGPAQRHPAYREDAWDPPTHLTAGQCALIVGNGLTMADAVFSLTRDLERAPRLVTISRRGLIPLPQTAFHATAVRGGAQFVQHSGSIRRLLAASRTLAREVEQLGGDWREVVTFIRSVAPRIWQRLPDIERRRFVRHLQSYWDVHRHRLPPPLAEHLNGLRRGGLLEINAGRIDRLEPEGDRLRVTWRRRGEARPQTLSVDAVINATGPDYSLRRSRSRLLRSLRGAGWVSADALDLGLRTTPQGACVGADGSASEGLYYLGPMLRAGHWEATAATELRNHAERLAQHLADAAL